MLFVPFLNIIQAGLVMLSHNRYRLLLSVEHIVSGCVFSHIRWIRFACVCFLPVRSCCRLERWLHASPKLEVLQQINRLESRRRRVLLRLIHLAFFQLLISDSLFFCIGNALHFVLYAAALLAEKQTDVFVVNVFMLLHCLVQRSFLLVENHVHADSELASAREHRKVCALAFVVSVV